MLVGANILYLLAVIVGAIFFVIPGLILAIYLSILNPIVINEEADIAEGFSRSFKLMKDKWWSTFGLLVIMGLITYVVLIAISIPTMLMTFIWGFNSLDSFESGSMPDISETEQTIFVVVTTITTLLSYFAYALPNVALGFQYYNLVERQEAKGLMTQIDQMGGSKEEEQEGY